MVRSEKLTRRGRVKLRTMLVLRDCSKSWRESGNCLDLRHDLAGGAGRLGGRRSGVCPERVEWRSGSLRRLDSEVCELSEVRAGPPGLLRGGALGRLAVAGAPDCASSTASISPSTPSSHANMSLMRMGWSISSVSDQIATNSSQKAALEGLATYYSPYPA